MTVDQTVNQAAVISMPLDGTFDINKNGLEIGSVDWEVYTSADEGFKLTVSSDGTPAMRDSAGGNSISDYRSDLASWSVAANDRRFGFSAKGDNALSGYGEGTKWRGFKGRRALEVARRRKGPISMTRTTVRLASEMRRALPASSKPHTSLTATAMKNI